MKKWTSFLIAIMLAWTTTAWAALADVDTSIGADDAYEINYATPGTAKTFLGTRLRGPLTQGATTVSAGTSNPAMSEHVTPTTTTFLITTGAATGESYRLGDGQIGQTLTAVLVTDGGKNYTITPYTKTGFTSIQLDDAKDSATLKFIDSTTGWVIVGNNAATIN